MVTTVATPVIAILVVTTINFKLDGSPCFSMCCQKIKRQLFKNEKAMNNFNIKKIIRRKCTY